MQALLWHAEVVFVLNVVGCGSLGTRDSRTAAFMMSLSGCVEASERCGQVLPVAIGETEEEQRSR
jgi:hypothetical protein